MSENLQRVVKEYHAFYEVSPYYVMVEEKHGGHVANARRVQAGFDVDVYGVSNKSELELPPPPEYAVSYAELKKIADTVSLHASGCSIEVIPFPSTVFLDARKHFQPEGMLRIRISHQGGVDQPSGLPEQRALEEIENQLKSLGVARR